MRRGIKKSRIHPDVIEINWPIPMRRKVSHWEVFTYSVVYGVLAKPLRRINDPPPLVVQGSQRINYIATVLAAHEDSAISFSLDFLTFPPLR